MNAKVPELSIFFPFWNEEENIEQVVKNGVSIAKKVAKKWEIIIVDDGSSDRTLQLAKKLEVQLPNIRVVSHVPNRGYGAALKDGFSHARYERIVFTDGDGQFDFSEVTKFLDKISGVDMVIGYRKKRHDHPFRHLLMNLLKVWDLLLFGFYFKDIDCGFKMFTRETLDAIIPLQSEGAMITSEILAKAKRLGLRIVQVEVTHYPRVYGNQSGGNLRVVLRAVRESLLLWYNLHYGRS